MARKSLEKQIAGLKFDAKLFAAKKRNSALSGRSLLQTLSPDAFSALQHVSEGFDMLGLSTDSFFELAMRNRLPKILQDHYVQMRSVFEKDDKAEDLTACATSQKTLIEDRYPRWQRDIWSCACGEQKTLWHKTHFTFHDRNQIYCETCRTLAGWGSDRDFKAAQNKGEATWIIITHPLDCEAFTPPLMIPAKTRRQPNQIRAKQSQRRPIRQTSIRAKRSQKRP